MGICYRDLPDPRWFNLISLYDMKWTMKNGQQIDVDDMDDNHVKNTINLLRRNLGDRTMLKLLLLGEQYVNDTKEQRNKEIYLNGEMAQDFNDIHEEYQMGFDEPPYFEDHLWR